MASHKVDSSNTNTTTLADNTNTTTLINTLNTLVNNNNNNSNNSLPERSRSIRFPSPSLPPITTAPSPAFLPSSRSYGLLSEFAGSMTTINGRRSISPPIVERPDDNTVRDSPVSARSIRTPPLPQIPGSPTSMKPLPSHPPTATAINTTIPAKHPDRERFSNGRMSNMTFRTAEKPFAPHHDKRRSNATNATAGGRRAESMAPSYTSTVMPGRQRARTPGPFDRISTEPTFAARVFDAGKTDLLYEVDESTRWPWRFEDVKHGVLDLTTLMRMQQHVLQQKLVAQVNALGQKGAWMEIGVGETMKEYCQLTRDMDYINTTAPTRSSSKSNPFLISTTDTLEAQLLEEGGLIARKASPSSSPTSPTSPTSPDAAAHFETHISRLPYSPELVSPWRAALRRWLAVISAALALLLPFLVMMLVPTFVGRMATTCAMIAVFALVAAASEVETKRAVAYVLGYGGALIIFGGLVPPVNMWAGVGGALGAVVT